MNFTSSVDSEQLMLVLCCQFLSVRHGFPSFWRRHGCRLPHLGVCIADAFLVWNRLHLTIVSADLKEKGIAYYLLFLG